MERNHILYSQEYPTPKDEIPILRPERDRVLPNLTSDLESYDTDWGLEMLETRTEWTPPSPTTVAMTSRDNECNADTTKQTIVDEKENVAHNENMELSVVCETPKSTAKQINRTVLLKTTSHSSESPRRSKRRSARF